jgi:AcrR family transcriptional regulator
MTDRGDATRAKLIDATLRLVREVGYARATTRAIAVAAGVAEGTIYRHFPDKPALFIAAVMERNAPLVEWTSRLPGRAGAGTLTANLVECLSRLAVLREDLLPLELALLTDPELGALRPAGMAAPGDGVPAGPPEYIARYLAAEQELGRVRSDVSPERMAVVLLVTLFGLSLRPPSEGSGADHELLHSAVALIVEGIAPRG